jgi:hypothetical protein
MTPINGTAIYSLASIVVLTRLESTYVPITTLFIPTDYALNEGGQGRIQCAFSGQNERKLTEQIILNRNVFFFSPKRKGHMSILSPEFFEFLACIFSETVISKRPSRATRTELI